jgi:adenine-specific DNA methylase
LEDLEGDTKMKLKVDSGEIIDSLKSVPTTRYQGSKRKILPWLHENFKLLKFENVLDGFGGTASVSYLFKLMGKKVTFNDMLLSNYQTGVALIENDSVKLNRRDIDFLLHENGFDYPTFIQDTFKGIYYLDEENKWLDMISLNIEKLSQKYSGEILKKKKALAYHILFQACLCKRPFNLFHRKNLHLRTARVRRTFGNKKTWDTNFLTLFTRFHNEVSRKIFSNGYKNKAICKDVMKIRNRDFDLVYLDPPYTRPDQKTPKDYHSMYHFLEGMVDYHNWPRLIDWSTLNRCLIKKKTGWEKNSLEKNFDHLFRKFKNSIIAVSYGDPGTPSVRKIKELLQQYKSKVIVARKQYNYKLNHRNGDKMHEVLIIGR